MTVKTEKSVQLSQAKAGQTYQICNSICSESMSQKLTLMGLGIGMMVELMALYKHGAVVKTPFGNIAVGPDLINSISVSVI